LGGTGEGEPSYYKAFSLPKQALETKGVRNPLAKNCAAICASAAAHFRNDERKRADSIKQDSTQLF
jgi:hypothetical protein